MKTLSLALALGLAAGSLHGISLINETWSDGERATQALAGNSMAWFSSAGGSNVTTAVGSMYQATGSSGRHILAYFTDSGSPVTLADGQSLQLDFTVAFPRATALGNTNEFRVGLWDSQTGRVSTDDHKGTSTGSPNTNFVNYTGYIYSGGVDVTRSISLRRKNAPSDPILIASTSVYTTLGSTASDHTTLAPGTDYTGQMILARSGDTLDLTYRMSLGETTYALINRQDTASPYFSFDTVGFLLGSNLADGFTLKQVQISLTEVPEPAHAALALGVLLALGLAVRRRA